MNKKILFATIAILVVLGGVGSWWYWKKVSGFDIPGISGIVSPKPREPLGEAQIVVYAKGEKIVLDPNSPHFKELQLACEEIIESSEPLPSLEKETGQIRFGVLPLTKYKEYDIDIENAVKLNYLDYPELPLGLWLRKKGINRFIGRFTEDRGVSSVLIPLSGRFAEVSHQGQRYACLISSIKGIPRWYSKRVTEILHPFPSFTPAENLQKIKNILREKFDIKVP